MRIRKDKMVKAIDQILAEHDKRQAAYEKALPAWQKERLAIWIRTERPKWIALQKLIAANSTGQKFVDHAAVKEIFGEGRYTTYNLTPYYPDEAVPTTLKFEDGHKVLAASGINTDHLKAMKKLLEAIEDDVVSDQALAKLGVKDVTPIFRAAVEMGGLVG